MYRRIVYGDNVMKTLNYRRGLIIRFKQIGDYTGTGGDGGVVWVGVVWLGVVWGGGGFYLALSWTSLWEQASFRVAFYKLI